MGELQDLAKANGFDSVTEAITIARQSRDILDPVKLGNAILSTGMVPGIFRGSKRWQWALQHAEELVKRLKEKRP